MRSCRRSSRALHRHRASSGSPRSNSAGCRRPPTRRVTSSCFRASGGALNRLVNRRIRLFLAALALAFAVQLLRATWLQAVRAESLSSLRLTQHRESVAVPAGRGTIYDRRGVELALGEPATTVFANPKQIPNPRRAALAVERTLGVNADRIYPLLADRSHGFVYVARQADTAQAAALKRLKLPGFGFYPEESRNYPQRSVAVQVLGYVGVDGNGLDGTELRFDRALAGRAGRETIVKDPSGRVIDTQTVRAEVPGEDVYLTLDHTIQANAEEVLRETVRKWSAKSATAIVLDPRTGAILAMAVQPGYDANRFPAVPGDLQRNRAVTDTYEPGSTFKVVTVAAALSEKLVTPATEFTLPYSIHVADRVACRRRVVDDDAEGRRRRGDGYVRRDFWLRRCRQDGHGAEARLARGLRERGVRRVVRRDRSRVAPAPRRARHRGRAARRDLGRRRRSAGLPADRELRPRLSRDPARCSDDDAVTRSVGSELP